MKQFEQSEALNASSAHKFLIERHGEIEVAIGIVGERLGSGYAVHGRADIPDVYPFVAILNPDDEYDVIDVICVSLRDFEINKSEVHLDACLRKLYNAETMRPWLLRIEETILEGREKSITFNDIDDEPNPDNQYRVNDHQIQFIRDQGYKVEWHKYPRSYEVSGW